MTFELSQTTTPTAPQGILDVNEKALLKKAADAPEAALKELKQKWTTLMGLKKPGDPKGLWEDIGVAYRKFVTFHEGIVTVPRSLEELKAGKYRYLLSTYIADYYDQRRAHLAYEKPEAPSYDPGTAPPIRPVAKGMPVGLLLGAGGAVALLIWLMVAGRRR